MGIAFHCFHKDSTLLSRAFNTSFYLLFSGVLSTHRNNL